MDIHVFLKNYKPEVFAGLRKYQTNNGELDILSDSDFVVATFATGEWVSVQRKLGEGEEWPAPDDVQGQEENRTGDSLLDGIPVPGFDYQ